MNFEDEHYVRIYTRDTKTWKRWGWEAQTVFMHVMRKLDKAGVLDDIDEPVPDVALMTGLPEEIVAAGLHKILEAGALELHGTTLVAPKYIEAQTAAKTDSQRQKECRERRRAVARSVTIRDTSDTKRDEPVTNPDETVTGGHSLSLSAVQCSADQRSAVQVSAESAPTREASSAEAPHPTPSAAKPKPDRRKPKRPIPPDWTPKPRHFEKATERGADCALAAEKFRGHAESVDRRCSDWDRAFDNWLLNEKPQSRTGAQRSFDPFAWAAEEAES